MSNDLIVQTPTPITLLEQAVAKGVDISQLKELMDLQERWEKKEAKKEFLAAMSRFQTIVPEIKKTKTAKINSSKGFFQYKYADLGGIAQSIKKALNECGLSYRWELEEANGKIKCKCLVSHSGGHTEVTTMEGGKDDSGAKNSIQQAGSTQTYLQRYSLIGALGLSTAEEDTDGKTSEKQLDKITEDELLDQWQQAISQVNTKIQLTGLYTKNKKAIDSNPKVQAMMKKRQEELKTAAPVDKTPAMP